MASKKELQTQLKDQYGINKNISQSLSAEDCEQLLRSLQGRPEVAKIVESFSSKNSDLSNNNRHYGQQRSSAERKLKAAQSDYRQLEQQIDAMAKARDYLTRRKQDINAETQQLEADIQQLSSKNQALASKVQTLTTRNDELLEANTQLKKDNKDLKNIVDQIRLRLARDTQMLLQYEDSEIRKAMIRLFRWTLG